MSADANSTERYAEHTPVMRQYLTLRDQNPGVLLLYRLGDFYELFMEDAVKASRLIGLTLTSRGKDARGNPIPMAGVPAATLEQYLAKLVRCGESVAICEQMGEATPGRGMIERKIVRIVTPGTLTDATLLPSGKDKPLLAYVPARGRRQPAASLVWLTLSSGTFRAQLCPPESVAAQIARIDPGEILVSEAARDDAALEDWTGPVTTLPDWHFDAERGRAQIQERFGLEALTARGLAAEPAVLSAVNAVLGYVEQTQCDALPFILPIEIENDGEFIFMDPATRRNLEITETLRGDDGPTLAGVLDTCRTAMGSRRLRAWLHQPLRDARKAAERHRSVAEIMARDDLAAALEAALTNLPDIERVASRLALRSIRPRELAGLRDALFNVQALCECARSFASPLAAGLADDLALDPALRRDLEETLLPEPATLLREGDVIDSRCSGELADIRAMRDNAGAFLAELEVREREQTGIASLKVEYNRVSGYYIEVPKSQADKVPDGYRRRQTLKNCERYVNAELKAYEDKALSAKERAAQLERELWDALLTRTAAHVPALMRAAAAAAVLDTLASFARHAASARWCAPDLTAPAGLEIRGARHPVVEHMIEHYVPNDCTLVPGRRLLIITGPNMGGKSTYMRSIALIALLAYAGSFVPAASCRLGPVDKILTRIGASDDLARGRSTFMVEMTEAAAILHQATNESLVLMDEIGRGTSTFDGLSLAAGIARELAEHARSWALFATHYFELTQLAVVCRETANIHVSADENKNGIVFLHDIKDGPASQSYGIAVAKLAGMPARVIREARNVLAELEERQLGSGPQMDLFGADAVPPHASDDAENRPAARNTPDSFVLSDGTVCEREALEALVEAVRTVEADALTPRQALDVLYQLQDAARDLTSDRA